MLDKYNTGLVLLKKGLIVIFINWSKKITMEEEVTPKKILIMKIFEKIVGITNLVLSVMIYSQQLNPQNKQKLQIMENTSQKYIGEKFKVLLEDVPEINMIRISPNNPEMGVHTFIIGFVDNATFSKTKDASSKNERITLYVKANNRFIKTNQLTKEDITKTKAIEKYGDVIITSIIK